MIGSVRWKPIGFYRRIIWQMIENLSRRYDCRLHALLRPSLAHGIIIGILYRIEREKCLANWLASRGRSYRGLFPGERNVFAKKKVVSRSFLTKSKIFWKNRLVAFEVKNARYISKRSIYIYTSLAKEEGTNFIQLSSSFFNQLFRFLFSRTLVTFSSETRSFLDLAVSTWCRWYTWKRSIEFLRC